MPTHAAQIDRDIALTRTIAVINEKGGVGKTSIAANLAGQFAASGYRVLLVDLNRQANLADDLGFRGSPLDDQGQSLVGALQSGVAPVPAREVRPGLDIICGGSKLEDLTPLLLSRLGSRLDRGVFRILGDVLAPVAGDYDLVLVDCPPESTVLTDLAQCAARWVLMPTKSDTGGLMGMGLVAERFQLNREINPQLGLLGVVLFATGTQSKAIHAEVSRRVGEAFGGTSPLFTARIRHAERTAQDARRLGRLAHELEADLESQPAWWEALRNPDGPARTGPRVSPTAASVAGDYRDLAVEVLAVLRDAEQAADEEAPVS